MARTTRNEENLSKVNKKVHSHDREIQEMRKKIKALEERTAENDMNSKAKEFKNAAGKEVLPSRQKSKTERKI